MADIRTSEWCLKKAFLSRKRLVYLWVYKHLGAYSQTLPAILFGQILPMTKVFPLTFVFIIVLTACRTDKTKDKGNNFQTILTYDTTKTVIIPLEREINYPFNSLEYKPATLTKQDIEQIERSLIESVADYNNSLTDGHDDFKIDLTGREYKKQLVAVTNLKGEKEVWVNCFCDEWNKAWRTQVVSVEDGGTCYFNFKLNLTTKKIYDLAVNGYA